MNATATLGTRAPRRTLRSVGAVLAGLLVILVVTTATDMALRATGVYPPIGQRMAGPLFLIATLYRIVYGVLGCYITARLAPARPRKHALVLGGIGTALATTGAIAMWKAGPPWYSLAIIAISLPCAWLGGRLADRSGRPAA